LRRLRPRGRTPCCGWGALVCGPRRAQRRGAEIHLAHTLCSCRPGLGALAAQPAPLVHHVGAARRHGTGATPRQPTDDLRYAHDMHSLDNNAVDYVNW
jgi:hypothetical protein